MRKATLSIIAAMLILGFGFPTRPSGNCETESPRVPVEDLCQAEGDPHRDSLSLEDHLIKERLLEQGEQIIEEGRATDMRLLIKLLDQPRCDLNLPSCVSHEVHREDLYRSARDSIVVVGGLYKCTKCTKWHASMASGFVITASGAVVTNYHVVNNPNRKALVVMTNSGYVYPVREVLAANRASDLAILKIEAEDLTPLPIAGTRDAAPVGADITVISHPAGQFYCCTSGIISRYMKTRRGEDLVDNLSITADYARGSSGAPVLNRRGQVVGIVQATDSVYYTETPQVQKNLQMVLKKCIPAHSLLELISSS
jgi:hypothetical protein